MNRTEDSSTVLQITAECIITDPAERQRRLAQVYEIIMDFGRQRRAAMPEASSEPDQVAGPAGSLFVREGINA
jgi:hypothetical protein